ncbi:hypothetical protein D3C85_1432100 [compost metagenome]
MDVALTAHVVIVLEHHAPGLQPLDDVVQFDADVPTDGIGLIGAGEVGFIDRQPGRTGAIAQHPLHRGVGQVQLQHI